MRVDRGDHSGVRAARRFFFVALAVTVLSFLIYGVLGDWGNRTTDDLPDGSARAVAIVISGSAVLLFGIVSVGAVLALGVLSLRSRRNHP